jgi:hypothetical protein
LLRGLRWCGAVLVMGWMAAGLAAAQTSVNAPFDGAGLVRRAVQHRLDMDKGHQMLRYVLRKKDARRETTKEIIETKDGDVARLIAIDGKPLNAEEERAEMERLATLAAHPELEERRRRNEIKDQGRIDDLLGVLQERLTRLDAHWIVDVDFGYGILGKLNKGGTASLRQTDVGGHEWKLTQLEVNLTGKALMVKSLNIQIDEEASGFLPVAAGMSYRDAIEMLKKPKSAAASQ